MNTTDLLQTVVIFSLTLAVIYLHWFVKTEEEQNLRILEELSKHRKVRDVLYAEFADPAKIEEDFERSARLREMRDANRTTLPREGAGPPAKVYRPKMRNKRPGDWRQPRA